MVAEALNAGLTGMEFAGGIPGSIGGGLYMNAGAMAASFARLPQSALALTRIWRLCGFQKRLAFPTGHSAFMETERSF